MRVRICLSAVLMFIIFAGPAAGQNRFGFFGGINIANQGGDMEEVGNMLAQEFETQFGGTWDSEKSSSTGFGLGLSYFIQTSPTFGIQIEGQYIRRGSKIQTAGRDLTTAGIPSSLVVTTTFKLNYFELPALVRYSPSPEANVRPVFLAGPVIGIKTGANFDVEVGGSSQSVDASSGYQDYNVGLIGAIGMDIRAGENTHILLQARYYLGLTNPIDDPTIEAKSGDFGLFAGLEFPIKPRKNEEEANPKL